MKKQKPDRREPDGYFDACCIAATGKPRLSGASFTPIKDSVRGLHYLWNTKVLYKVLLTCWQGASLRIYELYF